MAPEHSVSVLGLGLMGSAIARVLLQKGWKVTVWNRTSAKAQPLISVGATAAKSAGECIGASKLVITCFIDPSAFEQVFTGVDPRLCSHRIVVDYTAGIVADIQRCQKQALNLSFAAYIRGAILTTPSYVGLPESVFYHSGNKEAYKTVETALAVLGQPYYLGQDVASATLQEAVFGHCFYGFATGFLQAMSFLKSSNLYSRGGAERFMNEVITPTLVHGFPNMFADVAKQIDREDYVSKGDGARLDTLSHALDNLIKATEEMGQSSSTLKPIRELIEKRINQGGAAEEMSSLVEIISHPEKR